ncbi:MAG TPA: hypothetical protein VJR24_12830 [Gemmatimonadaceae bacterium]|nr:hypothetical protein [Gemmatimonadaceae bacterium]
MDATARALTAFVVVSPLIIWIGLRLWRAPTAATAVQGLGALGLLGVVLIHVCEALRLFPRMGWGLPHSVGHYLDLVSAMLALTLVPSGLLLGRRGDAAR